MDVVLRDPDLAHQVVLERDKSANTIVVTCNCLKRMRRAAMGPTDGYAKTVELYNDPANHVGGFDRHDLKWKVFDLETDGMGRGH